MFFSVPKKNYPGETSGRKLGDQKTLGCQRGQKSEAREYRDNVSQYAASLKIRKSHTLLVHYYTRYLDLRVLRAGVHGP